MMRYRLFSELGLIVAAMIEVGSVGLLIDLINAASLSW
jgi:hypothetical protein